MNIFYHVIFQILKLRLAESCPDILQVYTVHLTRDCCSFHVWLRSVRFAHNSAQKWVCVKVQHLLSAPDSPKLTIYHKWLWLILANPFVNRLQNITFRLFIFYFIKWVISWSLMMASHLHFEQGTLPVSRPYFCWLPPIKANVEWKVLFRNFGALAPGMKIKTLRALNSIE